MKIWFKDYNLDEIKFLEKKNMLEHLGIEVTEIGNDYLCGRMPVDERTVQSMNTLHGGASVALAESLGSIATFLTLDPEKYYCVGMEINANHLRRVRSGYVYATARPLHRGRRTQVWSIDIVDEDKKLVCVSRITMAIVENRGI